MKRSEALDKLKQYLGAGPYAADEVLAYIEDIIGMQPPTYFDKSMYDEPECDGMISEWENE